MELGQLLEVYFSGSDVSRHVCHTESKQGCKHTLDALPFVVVVVVVRPWHPYVVVVRPGHPCVVVNVVRPGHPCVAVVVVRP